MATKLMVCLVLFATASAVPLVRDDLDSQSVYPSYQCARQCSGSQNKFKYERDTTYFYEYKAEAETNVAGASEDKAKMYIETQAKIEVLDTCEFALKLQDVKIFHSQPNSESMKPAENSYEFKNALIQSPLRFSFDDGLIRDICHDSQEKVWVLNFKRGLLSAFQNSMDDLEKDQTLTEIDVTGECQAEYTKKSDWIWQRSTRVAKTKNLQACYQHSGMRTLIPMVPYRVPSEIQNLPIMKSTHECDFTIGHSQILKSAVCKESHVFAPFSNQQSGGSTKVQQTLTYVSTRQGVDTREGDIAVRSNLLFQHLNGIDEVQNSKRVAEQKLMEICQQTKDDVQAETPRLFNEIVTAVKNMESSDLEDLYTQFKDNTRCRRQEKAMKFLLDSLPIANTKGSLELMATVINNNEIPDLEKTVWLTSLSLMPQPTEDMLPSILKLLNGNYADQALLPVSSWLNTMCRKNVNCDQSYMFKRVVAKINENIDSSCNNNEREQVMKTLRAIGNVGYGQEFMETLKRCLNSRFTPLEVKVAATEAFRRFKCQDNEEDGVLMEVYQARNADAEVRIMSFLSLMRCPKDSMLRKISDQHQMEENSHVGTFVYSYMENLKQTSDPHKQDMAEMVKRFDWKPFEDSGFRTSKCHESSALLNRLNLGYVADGDLIWSDNSMLPRAMRLNLTVEMFGNSINFFEAGARMDGVDRFIQKYFGTEGYLSQNQASPEDLEAFIYARMFGNELFFKHMKGTQEHEKIKSYLNIEKLLENLSQDYDYKYTHSQQLMDQSLIIPTVIGLPVNLTMNSSVVVDAQTNGNINLGGILSRSKPITVTNNFAASAGLEVTGSMMVDAMLYKQGVRMRNTLHTSINTRATMKIVNKQIVDFELQSPEEKQEIFDARSQFFIVHDNVEKEQEMIKENRREMEGCTGEKFAKATGMELCGELKYPNASLVEDAPYFPLTGPVKASLVMYKKDTHRSYRIFAKWVKNSRKLEAQLQLDTPGSQVDRHITTDLTIGTHKNSHIDLVIISPWKKIVLNTKAAMDDSISSLTGDVLIDDSKRYKLTSEMKTREVRHGLEFTPFMEIEKDGEKITLLKGTVTYTDRIVTQLELQDWNRKLYTIATRLINTSEEKRIDVSVGEKDQKPYRFLIGSAVKVSGRQDSNLEVDPQLVIQDPEGDIVNLQTSAEIKQKPVKVSFNMAFNSDLINMEPTTLSFDVTQRRKTYPVSGKLQNSLGVKITADLNGKVELNNKKIPKASMTLRYKTPENKEIITFNGKLLDRSKLSYKRYNVKSELKFKFQSEYDTESTMKISHKNSVTTLDADVKFTNKQTDTRRKQKPDMRFHLETNIKDVTEAKIKAALKAEVPGEDLDVKMTFHHEHSLKNKRLNANLKMHLAPLLENDINADLSIDDKGRNLFDVKAIGNLEVVGLKYNVQSELLQKSKRRFEHSITISDQQQDKHSMITIYKNTNDRYEINSDIQSPKLDQPLSIEVFASLKELTDLNVRGAVNQNRNQLYYMDALSKYVDDKAGKWNLELAHPERKVKAQLDFTKANNRIETEASVNWDVMSRQQPAPEVRVVSQLTHVSDSDSLLLNGNIKLFTPFESLEKVITNLKVEKSKKDLKSVGQISYDNKQQFFGKLIAKLPVSAEKVDVQVQAKTPFEKYTDIKAMVKHNMDSEIKTQVKAVINKEVSEMIFKGTKQVTRSTRNIQGQVKIKTPYDSFKHIEMLIDHTDDDKKIQTSAQIKKDGESYNVDLQYSRDTRRSKTERSGKLNLSGPQRSAEASFTHKIENGQHQFEALMKSEQNNRRNRYSVDVTGSYQNWTSHSLSVDIETPMKRPQTIGLQIKNALEQNQLKSKLIFEINKSQTGYDLELRNRPQDKSAEIILAPGPMFTLQPLHVKSKLQYGDFPVTLSGQIGWSPSSIIGFTGSYKAQSLDDMEANLKLTTPFENVKNIELLASHVLTGSQRVSHINVDYGMRKLVDIEIRSQNDADKKELRVKVTVPSDHFQHIDTGVSIDLRRGVFTKSDIELQLTPENKYQGTFTLNAEGIDSIRGTVNVKTPIAGLEQIEGSFVRDPRNANKNSYLTLNNNGDKLIDVKVETEVVGQTVYIQVITQGKLLPFLLETVDELHIFPKMHEDKDGNRIQRLITEVKVTENEQQAQIDNSVIFDYGKDEEKISSTVRVSGNKMSDIDVYVSLSHKQEAVHGYFIVKLSDDVQVKVLVEDIFGGKHGIEYTQSRNSARSEYKATVYLHELRKFESSVELFVSSIQRIEFVSVTKTDIQGFKLRKIVYTHEGQDNRASCSFSVEDDTGINASVDLVAQISPIHLFSFVVRTPFNDYNKMVVSGNYDETKFEALLQMNDNKKISLTGVHDNFKNPKFTLKTPLRQLQELYVNVDGKLWDGSHSFTLKSNDYDQIDGKVAIKYEGYSHVEFSAQLTQKIDRQSQDDMKFELTVTEQPKVFRVLIAANEKNQVKYDSRMTNQKDMNGMNHFVDIEINYEALDIDSRGIVMHLKGGDKKGNAQIQLIGQYKKIVDAELFIEKDENLKGSLIVREPKHMEYSFSQENFPNTNTNQFNFNWNKNNPESSFMIKATQRSEVTMDSMVKAMTVRISCPGRSIGVEHSLSASGGNIQSTGKLYWNDDRESQLSYDLKLNDQSSRRQTSYDGQLKMKLPTRSIGMAGYAKDDSDQQQAGVTFSWDLEKDARKKVGVQVKVQKGSFTQADISLILPEDAHVDSKLVMNKGNTILEGQTQIFYSDDSRKTLTLFSKLENNPGYSSYFYSNENNYNYSIQLGLSHPDSKVDVKMVSHLGVDSDRLTTSVGFDYLTSRRQMKNLDLFMEINQLKKEINLHAATPYKNAGITGSIKHNPLELKAVSTIDNQHAMTARFLVDQDQKKVQFDYTDEDKELHYSVGFPNRTALLLQRVKRGSSGTDRDLKLLIQLATPTLVKTDLEWRPGMIKEMRDRIFQLVKLSINGLAWQWSEISADVKNELRAKYHDIKDSTIDDLRNAMTFADQEILRIQNELDQMQQNLRNNFDFCDIEIGSFELKQEIHQLQRKLQALGQQLNSKAKQFTQSYRDSLQEMSQVLDMVKELPFDIVYDTVMREISWIESRIFNTFFWDFLQMLKEFYPQTLEAIWDYIHHLIEKQYDPQAMINELNQGMESFKNTKITSLISKVSERNLQLVSKLRIVIQKFSDFVAQHPFTQQVDDMLEDNVKELYQLVKWSVKYLELDNKVPEQLENLMEYLNEIIEEELKKNVVPMLRYVRNPVTRFDPTHGIIQAEFPLIFSVDRLDELPTILEMYKKIAVYLQKEFGTNSSNTPVTYRPMVFDRQTLFERQAPVDRQREVTNKPITLRGRSDDEFTWRPHPAPSFFDDASFDDASFDDLSFDEEINSASAMNDRFSEEEVTQRPTVSPWWSFL